MSPEPDSQWIPTRRLRAAFGLAAALLGLALGGALVTRWSLALLPVSAGVAWAGVQMIRVRRALSAAGGGWQRRIHALVAERLAARGAAGHGLDVGCGDGGLILLLLDRLPGTRWTGVDRWGEGWDAQQARCEARVAAAGCAERADFARMSATALEVPDGRYDLVTSVLRFHETPDPLGAAREALRALRPGGWFVLIEGRRAMGRRPGPGSG